MQIRPLTSSDAASFQALRLRGLQECPAAFASSYDEEASTPIESVARRIAVKPDGALFGAFDAAALLAVAGVQREALRKLAHKAYVWGVYVAPEARRNGVGTRLLRHLLAYAATSLGVRQVNIGVNTRNVPAVALYRKLGFVEFGVERGFLMVDGVLHDEYLMVARVHAAS